MQTHHIALVPEAHGVNPTDLARVSAALQKQVLRDLGPIWNVNATVDAFPQLEDVPVGYWPILISFCKLGRAAGVRIDRNGQPYAQIEMSASWSLDASRACIELLTNPHGNRTATVPSPRADQGFVEVLLDLCGPCEDPRYAYVINDVLVSDFCTPAFFSVDTTSSRERYSYTGALKEPLEILRGGHLVWYELVSDECWLQHRWGEHKEELALGGPDSRFQSMREFARARVPAQLSPASLTVEAFEARMGVTRQHALQASQFRAHRLRSALGTGARPSEETHAGYHELDVELLEATLEQPRTVPPPLPMPSLRPTERITEAPAARMHSLSPVAIEKPEPAKPARTPASGRARESKHSSQAWLLAAGALATGVAIALSFDPGATHPKPQRVTTAPTVHAAAQPESVEAAPTVSVKSNVAKPAEAKADANAAAKATPTTTTTTRTPDAASEAAAAEERASRAARRAARKAAAEAGTPTPTMAELSGDAKALDALDPLIDSRR